MNEEYDTFEKYWEKVQRTALIELKETEEYAEEDGLSEHQIASSAADYAVDCSDLVRNHPRTVIYHCDNGMYDSGYDGYLRGVEFENNDPRDMVRQLACAGFYNDVKTVIDRILEAREDLGTANRLIEGTLWSEGVEAEYEYESGLIEPEYHTYKFEHISEGEWRVFDPNGVAFEVISPRVMVDDATVPVQRLKLKLDNLCARRQRLL
jgi:hypothetical protein